MTTATLTKVVFTKAAQISRDIELDAQALAGLDDNAAPVEFLNGLLQLQLYPDAVRFLARALPKREAAWWACLCARSTLNGDTRPEVDVALRMAEAWVYQPNEANRRAANSAAFVAGFDNPCTWAAMAAFWSEGSMAPENMPPVQPMENLTAKAAAGAVMLAAVQGKPEQIQDKYRFFIDQGIAIANGGNGKLWAD